MFGSSNHMSSSLASTPIVSVSPPTIGSSMPPFGASSNPALGNSSSSFSAPAFGSSMPTFGASSTPAFGNASSSFGASTPMVSASTPAFGGSMPAFGASSTPAFGSSSSPFGGLTNFTSSSLSSAPTVSASAPAFGSSMAAFGASSTPALGSSSSCFGASTPMVSASTPAFGGSMPAFGASSTPAFGSSSSPFGGLTNFTSSSLSSAPTVSASAPAFGSSMAAFGASSTPALGSSSSCFGASTPMVSASTPAFGCSMPAFGASSTTAIVSSSFGGSSIFGHGFGSSSPFGISSQSAFGPNSPVSGTTNTPAFGTTTTSSNGSQPTLTFGSIDNSIDTGFSVSGASEFGSGGAFKALSDNGFGTSSTSAFVASSTLPCRPSSTPAFSFGSTQAFCQLTSALGSTSQCGTTVPTFGMCLSSSGTQTSTATFGSSAFGQSTFGGQGRGSRIMAYAATTGTNVDGMYAENFESISAMPKYEDKSHEELRWEDYQVGDRGGPKPAVGQSAGGINSVTSTSDASGFGERSPDLSSSSPFSALSSTNHFMKTSSTTPHTLGAASSPAFGASSSPSLFGAWSPPGFGSFPAIFGCDSALGAAPLLVFGLNFVNTPSVLLSAAPLFWQTNAAFAQNTTPSFGPSNMPSVSTLFQPAAPFSINNSAQTSAGSSVFGQTPAFGLSSPFGICSQTAFGANCPVSGTTHTPAFGTTITSLNGFTPTPTFGSTGTGFAVSSAPAFGFGGALAFSDAGIGTSSTPAFGTSSVPGLVASSTLPCSASSIPTFSFGSTPAFCQSTSPFRSTSQFGTTLPTSGTRISPFGAQATTATFGGTTFGQAALGGQSRGSRVMAYTTTTADGTIENPSSISGMPKYDDRSHEELRWEDYQLGDRGGPNPAADQSAGGINFGVSSGDASGFGAQSPTPSSSSPFSAITSANHFGGAASPAFGASSSPSLFGAWSSPGFGSLPSIFDYASALGAAPPLGFGLNFVNIPSLLSSIAPLFGQTNAASTQNNTFEQNTTPSFGPSNMVSIPTPPNGFGQNVLSGSHSQLSPSYPVFGQKTVFQPAWPFSINNSAQSSAGSSVSSQGACAQRSLNFHPLYIGFLLLFCPLYKY